MSKSSGIVIVIAIIVTLLGALIAAESIVEHHRRSTAVVAPVASGPSYEQMKKLAGDLDFRRAEIETLEDRLQSLRDKHPGQQLADWGQSDEEQYQSDSTESRKLKTTYNAFALAYNAEMAKSGGRYTRKADIPEDHCCVLPASIKPYLDAPSPDAAALP